MRFPMSRLAVGVLALLLLGWLPALAEEKPPAANQQYAILIVGDEGNAEMLREEQALIAEIRRLLPKQPNARTLQVFSYHFNKEREKLYCEKTLNILREDLLFVGIVALKSGVPRKVVYRLDRITRASRAATDVLARAEEMLAPEPVATESPEPSPAASKSPTASKSPEAPKTPGAWRIQVGSFAELANAQDLVGKLKDKGYDSQIDHSNRSGTSLFRVYVGSYANRQEAQEALDKLKADGFDKAFVAAPEENAGRGRYAG